MKTDRCRMFKARQSMRYAVPFAAVALALPSFVRQGIAAGYPVEDVRVTVYHGKTHSVFQALRLSKRLTPINRTESGRSMVTRFDMAPPGVVRWALPREMEALVDRSLQRRRMV